MGQKPSPELMKRLDPDGNGNITFLEFVSAFEIWSEILTPRNKADVDIYKGSRVSLPTDTLFSCTFLFRSRTTSPSYPLQLLCFSSQNASLFLTSFFHHIQVKLTQEQMEEARKTFKKLDIDGDGNVTADELRTILKGTRVCKGLCSVAQVVWHKLCVHSSNRVHVHLCAYVRAYIRVCGRFMALCCVH